MKTSTTIEQLEAMLGGLQDRDEMRGTRPDMAAAAKGLHDVLVPLLQALPEADPPRDLFAAIEADIDALDTAPTQTVHADDGIWEQRSDKIWKKILAENPETGRSMYLLRCLPGASVKPHLHDRAEHLFIIEGEFWIDGKQFTAGDAQISLPGSEHALIEMPTGCLVLVSA